MHPGLDDFGSSNIRKRRGFQWRSETARRYRGTGNTRRGRPDLAFKVGRLPKGKRRPYALAILLRRLRTSDLSRMAPRRSTARADDPPSPIHSAARVVLARMCGTAMSVILFGLFCQEPLAGSSEKPGETPGLAYNRTSILPVLPPENRPRKASGVASRPSWTVSWRCNLPACSIAPMS